MNWKKIIVLLAKDKIKSKKTRNKVVTTFTKNSFNKALDSLGVKDRDDLAKSIQEVLSSKKFSSPTIRKVNSEINKALKKNFYDQQLTTSEKDFLNWYEKVSNVPSEKLEWVNVDSSWIIKAQYRKATKEVVLNTKRGKGIYVFYNVPRTKWLALVRIGGKFMWDWFGRHYSTNPRYWIRRRS